MSFNVEPLDDGTGRYLVKDDETGWFFPVENKSQAEFLKEKFDRVTEAPEPISIQDYFTEWENAVNELSEKEVELINLKEVYAEKEQEILTTTDFKKLYGANNDKVRKNHVTKTLQSMTDAQNDLDISISYLKRRIDFIKSLMRMQESLIISGSLE